MIEGTVYIYRAPCRRPSIATLPPRSSPPTPPSDHELVSLATAVALVWRFRHDRASGRRAIAATVASGKRSRFVFARNARALALSATTAGPAATSTVPLDSLPSRATVVTPSFALSSVCLAYAPTVADFPWVSYLLISNGMLFTRTMTTANLGANLSAWQRLSPFFRRW